MLENSPARRLGGRSIDSVSNLHRYLACDYRDGYWSYVARQFYLFDWIKKVWFECLHLFVESWINRVRVQLYRPASRV